ncbi:hypothetical protein P3T18_007308 [Paraburkholderia sp. GAS199]|uniref:hypothetical protein n=1 Tax=Paraburkholderia sp. GAS199 TaxID=3035126 RepID=UPI003D256C5A
MRPNHTATDFAADFVSPSPLLATPADAVADTELPQRTSAFTRMTFCFAWLFGLEPFLTGTSNEMPRSSFDRH